MAALRRQMEKILIASPIPQIDESTFTDFEFHVGHTPMTRIEYPLIVIACYCIGIPLLQRFMKNRESPPLKFILILHNLFLSVISGLLLLFLCCTLWSFVEERDYGYFHIYCQLNCPDQKGIIIAIFHYSINSIPIYQFTFSFCSFFIFHFCTGTLTFIYYINHLLKYYELLDTIFLALKHKPIGFLHAYHHPATLVLTWGQLVDCTGVQWVVISLNLFVHTVMYFYYAMAALKIRIPWKRMVTVLQIGQFVIDLWACYYAWISHYTHGTCAGTFRAGAVGCFVLTSYLYLFIDFYNEIYSKKKMKQKKA